MPAPSDPILRAQEDNDSPIPSGYNWAYPDRQDTSGQVVATSGQPSTPPSSGFMSPRDPKLTAQVVDADGNLVDPNQMPSSSSNQQFADEEMWLLNAMKLNGWPNADMWAARFFQALIETPPNNLPAMLDYAGSMVKRWGSNPEIAYQTWVSELKNPGYEFTLDNPVVPWNPEMPGGGGGGYGGGGGRVAPVYTPPDRRTIEYQITGMLGAKVGRAEKSRVKTLTDLFMTRHRFAWDNPNDGRNPWEDVNEKIRGSDDFQRIHKLRPDYIDEDEWVTLHQRTALSAGVNAQRGEQFAINQAQIGSTAEDSASAAGWQEFTSGRKTNAFKDRIRNATKSMMVGVR